MGISFLTLVSYCLTFSDAVAKQVEQELRAVRNTSVIYFFICRVCNLSFLMKSSSQMFRVLEKVTILLHLSIIFFFTSISIVRLFIWLSFTGYCFCPSAPDYKLPSFTPYLSRCAMMSTFNFFQCLQARIEINIHQNVILFVVNHVFP